MQELRDVGEQEPLIPTDEADDRVAKAIKSLLVRNERERQHWDEISKAGATDKALRSEIATLAPTGRVTTSPAICAISLQPTLRLFVGSYGGTPTLEGRELLRKIRAVFEIPEIVDDQPGATDVVEDDAGEVDPANPNEVLATAPAEEFIDSLKSMSDTELFQAKLRFARNAEDQAHYEAVLEEQFSREAPARNQLLLFDYSQLEEGTAAIVRDATLHIVGRLANIHKNTVEIGEQLAKVKVALKRGEFDQWLEREMPFSRDTADRMISAYSLVQRYPQIAEKFDRFSTTAFYLLGAASTPEAAVQEAVTRAEAGQTISPPVATEIIKRQKQSSPKPSTQSAPRKVTAPKVTKPVEAAPEPEQQTGVCAVCGCKNETPCVVKGVPCAWTDDEQKLCSACATLDYTAWDRSTINVTITLFPHDGSPQGRHISITAWNDQDDKKMEFVRDGDFTPFEGPVAVLLDRLKAELPERLKRQFARKRAELLKAQEEARAEQERKKKAEADARKRRAKPKTVVKKTKPATRPAVTRKKKGAQRGKNKTARRTGV